MNWLNKLFSAGVGQAVEQIGGVVERVSAGHLGKKEMQLELEKMLHERDTALIAQLTTEITSKEKIMVAELQQGDKFTKRARPTIVYVGLLAALFDGLGYDWAKFTMPPDFWYIWGGVCSVWVIGRSAEKYGAANGLVKAITGNGKGSKILD